MASISIPEAMESAGGWLGYINPVAMESSVRCLVTCGLNPIWLPFRIAFAPVRFALLVENAAWSIWKQPSGSPEADPTDFDIALA